MEPFGFLFYALALIGARYEFLDRLAHGIVPDFIDVFVGACYGATIGAFAGLIAGGVAHAVLGVYELLTRAGVPTV